MPRKLALFTLVLLLFCCCPARAHAAVPEIAASAAILYEPESGTILFAQNENERSLIASTTKLMTALVCLECCALEEEVRVGAAAAATEGSSMGLESGQRCTVRSLLYGLLLTSGNDAASALACHAAGSEAAFARLMNEKAAALGMENSHFENPHGLDGEAHYSTAKDMALLAAAFLEERELALIASTMEARTGEGSFENHNKLLRLCEGCLGLKTGYTSHAGRTLVTACEQEGTRLICVTLDDPDDWTDHAALYDWGFSHWQTVTAAGPGGPDYTLPLITGLREEITVRPGATLRLLLGEGEKLELEAQLPDLVYAPVAAGQRAGTLLVRKDGRLLARVPLVYAEAGEQDPAQPLNFWERLRWAWYFANEHAPGLLRGPALS